MCKILEMRGGAGLLVVSFLALSGFQAACSRQTPPKPEVVLYTSVDQRFAEMILEKFTQETGIKCIAVFDTEAGKTTGLVRRLAREADNPRCDVWWSSEVFGTIELARREVFDVYDSPAARDIPIEWKSGDETWMSFAARARVLAYNAARTSADDVPESWEALGARESLTDVAIANPQFGTTRGHVGALFAYWGADRATAFLQKLRDDDARITDGNNQAVMEVIGGGAALCLTDTDDVWVNQPKLDSLGLIYPTIERPRSLSAHTRNAAHHDTEVLAPHDIQKPAGVNDNNNQITQEAPNRTPRAKRGAETPDGTTTGALPFDRQVGHGENIAPASEVLWIPNSVALVKGGPNADTACKLIDFLVSAEVEKLLAESDSRNVPVRTALRNELNIDTSQSGDPVAPAFDAIADALPEAMQAAREILLK